MKARGGQETSVRHCISPSPRSANGSFRPSDSPFQPSQLLKKGLSCFAYLCLVYLRQISLIVKNVQQHSGDPREPVELLFSLLACPLFLLQPRNPLQAVPCMFNSAEGIKVFLTISLLCSEDGKVEAMGEERDGGALKEEEEEAYEYLS